MKRRDRARTAGGVRDPLTHPSYEKYDSQCLMVCTNNSSQTQVHAYTHAQLAAVAMQLFVEKPKSYRSLSPLEARHLRCPGLMC